LAKNESTINEVNYTIEESPNTFEKSRSAIDLSEIKVNNHLNHDYISE